MPFDGTTVNETAQILLRAKERIQRCGWHQGGMYGSGGSVCAVGAIREGSLVGGGISEAAIISLESVIGGGEVSFWNDAPGRTLEEVLAAFDRAIETALGAA